MNEMNSWREFCSTPRSRPALRLGGTQKGKKGGIRTSRLLTLTHMLVWLLAGAFLGGEFSCYARTTSINMRCIVRWTSRAMQPSRSVRLARLDHLLAQASQTGHYQRRSSALPECVPLEEQYLHPWLERIPRVELRQFLANPSDFYNWNHAPRPMRPLECPLSNTGRTAVLAAGFSEEPHARCFPFSSLDDIEEFEPDSLAGPGVRLRSLAEAILAGRLRLPSVKATVIAFTGLKFGCLREDDRDLFWNAFQVPVFEQFRGFSGELLAWECEAHDGLHVAADNVVFETAPRTGELLLTCLACDEYALIRLETEMAARLVTSPCGCGVDAPRLVGLRGLQEPVVAAAAAYAVADAKPVGVR